MGFGGIPVQIVGANVIELLSHRVIQILDDLPEDRTDSLKMDVDDAESPVLVQST
jgi:hypothetical protein